MAKEVSQSGGVRRGIRGCFAFLPFFNTFDFQYIRFDSLRKCYMAHCYAEPCACGLHCTVHLCWLCSPPASLDRPLPSCLDLSLLRPTTARKLYMGGPNNYNRETRPNSLTEVPIRVTKLAHNLGQPDTIFVRAANAAALLRTALALLFGRAFWAKRLI